MADEPVVTPPVAPAVVPPALPPVQAAIPGTGVPPANRPPGKKKGKRTDILEIPQREFKMRVDRHAAQIVKQRLGVSIEEAEKIIKAGGVTPPSASPAGVADQAITKMQTTLTRITNELNEVKNKNAALEKKNQKTIERMNDKLLDKDLRFLASQARVKDPDYAITLYARAVKAAAAAGEEIPKAEVYFPSLQATHAFLFEGATPAAPVPPVVVAPTTAPPESAIPGGATPPVAPPGAPPTQTSVDDMNAQDFNAHRRAKYGYTPGT